MRVTILDEFANAVEQRKDCINIYSPPHVVGQIPAPGHRGNSACGVDPVFKPVGA